MDLQEKSDYPNTRILIDIIEMLEDAKIMGCKYNMRISTVTDDNMCLFVAVSTANHSQMLIRQICYSTNCRQALEQLSYDIQLLLCNVKREQTENNQDLQLTLP